MTSLFLFGKVKTTDAKAKALASAAEKLITKVKNNDDMNAIRALKEVIFTEESSRKALEYSRKTQKTSGFTRTTKIGFRDGDRACLLQVNLINADE
jgi:large subunit ribosomal protein L17